MSSRSNRKEPKDQKKSDEHATMEVCLFRFSCFYVSCLYVFCLILTTCLICKSLTSFPYIVTYYCAWHDSSLSSQFLPKQLHSLQAICTQHCRRSMSCHFGRSVCSSLAGLLRPCLLSFLQLSEYRIEK